jgi:hypothetical protein
MVTSPTHNSILKQQQLQNAAQIVRKSVSFCEMGHREETIRGIFNYETKRACWYSGDDVSSFVSAERRRRERIGIVSNSCITSLDIALLEPPIK